MNRTGTKNVKYLYFNFSISFNASEFGYQELAAYDQFRPTEKLSKP